MTLRIVRRVGAIAVLTVGAVHLQQYLGDYQAIPTIGSLFLLNAIGSGAVALGLLVPIERWFGQHKGEVAVGLLALGAVAIAVGSLVALLVAETGTLFGFSEGTLETPMLIAIVAEVATVLLLGPVALANLMRASSGPRRTRSTGALSSG